MDYNRLTSSLLLVEFLKNRFLNRISNQFSWQFSRFRTLVTGKEAQRASPFRDESNSSSTYCHKFEATILFSPFIQPCHVSEKREEESSYDRDFQPAASSSPTKLVSFPSTRA